MSVSTLLDRFALPLAAAGLVFLIAAAPPPARAGHLLGDGSVVDAARGVVYVARPAGGIEALDLSTGRAVWQSDAAAKPLALAGGALLAQDEPGPAGELRLATLDPATGSARQRLGVVLPEGVYATVADGLSGAFRVRAASPEEGGPVLIAWTASAAPSSGFLPPDPSRRAPAGSVAAAEAPAARGVRRGAARLDLSSGRAFPADDSEAVGIAMAIDRSLARVALSGSAGDAGLPSIDGRHALVSERVAGAVHTYRWSISDRATGGVVAVLDAPVSLAPFVVFDGKVVYLAQPSLRREGNATIRRPLRLSALDLATGAEVWQAAVRNSVYTGPIPP